MTVLARRLLQVMAALALVWFGAWLVSPKSQLIQNLCLHTSLCPDPLMYLGGGEAQPMQTGLAVTNLRRGQSREVTVHFDLRGIPSETRINVLRVSRTWLSHKRSELTARPFGGTTSTTLYDDDDLTVTTQTPWFTDGKLNLTLTAGQDAVPSHSSLILTVQKPGTRWGSTGQASLRVWMHPADR